MDKEAYHRMIEQDNWPLIHDLNFRPLSYMDMSWFTEAGLNEDYAEVLGYCPDAANQWVLQQLNLANRFCFNFDHEAACFALFETQLLRNIVRYCGLARWHPFIKTLVWAGQRRIIREAVGDAGYDFALNAAPLLLGEWPQDILEKGELPLDSDRLPYLLDCSGLELFLMLTIDTEQALADRVMLKFPAHYKEQFSNIDKRSIPTEDYPRLLQLFKKVTKVIEPQCLYLLN